MSSRGIFAAVLAALLLTLPATAEIARPPIPPNPNQIFEVEAYGAVCDGVTDDTAAIQAAIDAAEAVPADPTKQDQLGTVRFPGRSCNVTNLVISAFGIRLLGVSPLTSKIIGTALTGSVIWVGHNQARIEALQIGASAARKAVAATVYADGDPTAGNHGILFTPDPAQLGSDGFTPLDQITQSRSYVRNVIVADQPDDGVLLEQPEIATIDTVISKENGRFGFHLNGVTLGAGTNNIVRNCRAGPDNTQGFFVRQIFNTTLEGVQAVNNDDIGTPQINVVGGRNVRLVNPTVTGSVFNPGVGLQLLGERHSVYGGLFGLFQTPIELGFGSSMVISFPHVINLTDNHADQVVKLGATSNDNLLLLGPLSGHTFVDALVAIDAGAKGNSVYEGSWRAQSVKNFASADATPDISSAVGGEVFKTNNAAPTTITGLDGGTLGQHVIVIIGDVNTTIDFTGTTLKGNGGVDWSAAAAEMMTCVYDETNWYCDVTSPAGGGLANVVEDTTPQLGGNLDVNGNEVVAVGANDITLRAPVNQDINLETSGTGVTRVSGLEISATPDATDVLYTGDADDWIGLTKPTELELGLTTARTCFRKHGKMNASWTNGHGMYPFVAGDPGGTTKCSLANCGGGMAPGGKEWTVEWWSITAAGAALPATMQCRIELREGPANTAVSGGNLISFINIGADNTEAACEREDLGVDVDLDVPGDWCRKTAGANTIGPRDALWLYLTDGDEGTPDCSAGNTVLAFNYSICETESP